jgi:organic hydroperoxide reductase OsmC/OhrA
MSEHAARIAWSRGTAAFDYESFSRDHTWTFPDGVTVKASSAPEFRGGDAAVDPEEALVGAVSACHMLTFLAIASKKRIPVDAYEDDAVGVLEKNGDGRLAVTRITLRPRVTFAEPDAVSAEELTRLHDSAHRNCFIANSIRCDVTVENPAGGGGPAPHRAPPPPPRRTPRHASPPQEVKDRPPDEDRGDQSRKQQPSDPAPVPEPLSSWIHHDPPLADGLAPLDPMSPERSHRPGARREGPRIPRRPRRSSVRGIALSGL